MHYTGQVYRPPTEWQTPLLEITTGCSHNKCAFCTMYGKTPFRPSKLEDVESDVRELRETLGADLKRLFLLNGDPFALSAGRLLRIADLIRSYFPQIETMTCYTSINDVRHKSFADLKALREAGFNDLYVGLETAWAPALTMMRKGFTVEEEYAHIARLKEAGFRYAALLMTGVGGKGNSEINVRETAKLLNMYHPFIVAVLSTAVSPGSELERLRDAGAYVELTEREMLEEEILLLDSLDMEDDCFYFGSHPFDAVPVSGPFRERDVMVRHLRDALQTLPPDFLDSVWQRGSI